MSEPRTGYKRSDSPLPLAVRRFVRARDRGRCMECGTSKRLTIHHIRPISSGGSALDPRNMVTLCSACHEKKHPSAAKKRLPTARGIT